MINIRCENDKNSKPAHLKGTLWRQSARNVYIYNITSPRPSFNLHSTGVLYPFAVRSTTERRGNEVGKSVRSSWRVPGDDGGRTNAVKYWSDSSRTCGVYRVAAKRRVTHINIEPSEAASGYIVRALARLSDAGGRACAS